MKKTPPRSPLVVYVSSLLVAALVFNPVAFAAQADTSPQIAERPPETAQTTRIRLNIQERGVGKRSRIKVTLQNNTEVKGYISRIEKASFALTDDRAGQTTTIAYGDVRKIGSGGFSRKVKFGVAVGAVVIVIAVVVIAEACTGNPSCLGK